ncbi:uracil-DNA glycosylase [Candidatus Parcubacteria bacterium]|nr:uracil-DNA glycosylase [Candidatus Parcubacteria bacterium]
MAEINKKNLEELKKIKQEILEGKNCPLYEYRIENGFYPVIGQGNHQAKIMFIGEAPGLNEAKTGYPFCGRAGKILDELLDFVDIKRKEIYITNILKDRPPGNRNPSREEIEDYTPYLERQIKVIKPKVICTLGNYSTAYIMEKYGLKDEIQGISKIRGKIFETGDTFQNIRIIPLYHPAVVAYNPNMMGALKKDFEILTGLKFS